MRCRRAVTQLVLLQQAARDIVSIIPVAVPDSKAGFVPAPRYVAEVFPAEGTQRQFGHHALFSATVTHRRFPVEHSGQKYFVYFLGFILNSAHTLQER